MFLSLLLVGARMEILWTSLAPSWRYHVSNKWTRDATRVQRQTSVELTFEVQLYRWLVSEYNMAEFNDICSISTLYFFSLHARSFSFSSSSSSSSSSFSSSFSFSFSFSFSSSSSSSFSSSASASAFSFSFSFFFFFFFFFFFYFSSSSLLLFLK